MSVRARAGAGRSTPHGGTRSRAWLLVVLLVGASNGARADERAERDVASIEREATRLLERPMAERPERGPRWVEERLTDAETYYRLHDYLRAIIVLTDLVERHESHPAVGNARALLADAMFEAGDMLGARTHYRTILDRSSEPRYLPYAERALGRLVEISVRTRSFEGVEAYFARIAADPASEAASATSYFRGKYVFGRAVPPDVAESGRIGDASVDLAALEEARRLFAAVGTNTTYGPQARYFVGVVHVLRRELPQALAAFEEVPRGGESSPEHRRVADLSNLAIGRLRHALAQYAEALEAYARISRTSNAFPRALYESAWSHIALEDPESAARALEVLAIAAPDSPLVPEAQIVRGNLLLRAERVEAADVAFREAGLTTRPISDELERMAQTHADLPAHFAQVVREQRETFSVDALLPERARRFSEADPQFERATSALTDLTTTRQLVRETAELVERLELALASRTVVNVFSDTRDQAQVIEMLRNRIARTRGRLLESSRGAEGSSELRAARERRRALERELDETPITEDAVEARDARRTQRLRTLTRTVRSLEVEIVGLEARITATEHHLARAPMREAAANDAVLAELANHRAAVRAYREQLAEVHREIELARLDVGVGDDAYAQDAAVRRAYEAAVEVERRLGGPSSPAVEASLRRLVGVERQLLDREAAIARAVAARTESIRAVVAEERLNLDDYRTRLALLEGEAEVVVGGVSTETFHRVRERFFDLVLRSEVGHVDVAWVDRERHRRRLEELTQARAIELEEIDAEYNDILDRSLGTGGAP